MLFLESRTELSYLTIKFYKDFIIFLCIYPTCDVFTAVSESPSRPPME